MGRNKPFKFEQRTKVDPIQFKKLQSQRDTQNTWGGDQREGKGLELGGESNKHILLENITVVSNAFYANLRNIWR